jgi:hypothetical protein
VVELLEERDHCLRAPDNTHTTAGSGSGLPAGPIYNRRVSSGNRVPSPVPCGRVETLIAAVVRCSVLFGFALAPTAD